MDFETGEGNLVQKFPCSCSRSHSKASQWLRVQKMGRGTELPSFSGQSDVKKDVTDR